MGKGKGKNSSSKGKGATKNSCQSSKSSKGKAGKGGKAMRYYWYSKRKPKKKKGKGKGMFRGSNSSSSKSRKGKGKGRSHCDDNDADTIAPTPSLSGPTDSPNMAPSLPTSTPDDSMPTVAPSTSLITQPPNVFTMSPAAVPTVSPMGTPTMAPTIPPTAEPTASPTIAPVMQPSASPTSAPSISPIAQPTSSPSSPTASPSSPTQAPTDTPTGSPTALPTAVPTASPTSVPTAAPTQSPTISPTISPTSIPTAAPTMSPTISPTISPTRSPTQQPTASPSVSPSVSPSLAPSQRIVLPTTLSIDLGGPGAAFTDQTIGFPITITNTGSSPAVDVVLTQELPSEGGFIPGTGTLDGNTLTFEVGELAPGESTVVTVEWQTPSFETTLFTEAQAVATNAPPVTDDEEVQVGIVTTVTETAVVSAGTGLRNRDTGTIDISGIPNGATITRAVLVWAMLYEGTVAPSNQITLQGQTVTADLETTISTRLCWGDDSTIGYAADVTDIVMGNGNFAISDAINGVIRPDSNPVGEFPYTDGASLFVFYGAPGVTGSVTSDFTYSAENASTGGRITRLIDGFESVGGEAILHLAGPDGQTNANGATSVTVTGSQTIEFMAQWDGSAPQSGPDFTIGNLWDNDTLDISAVMPAGQNTMGLEMGVGPDCVGLSALALQLEQ